MQNCIIFANFTKAQTMGTLLGPFLGPWKWPHKWVPKAGASLASASTPGHQVVLQGLFTDACLPSLGHFLIPALLIQRIFHKFENKCILQTDQELEVKAKLLIKASFLIPKMCQALR